MSIYINSLSQISVQKPLCDDWLQEPIVYKEKYVRAIEADYKQFIDSSISRRMGKILKRALACSLSAIGENKEIDAIITATGLGCIENTEKFLSAMVNDGETLLTPTFFMQSTHNTISSQIALFLKCNGYNCTYSHQGTSFESALLDAYMQLSLKKIHNALVGAFDEMTPSYFDLLNTIDFWGDENNKEIFASETSASFFLSTEKTSETLCELKSIDILHRPSHERLKSCLNHILQSNHLSIKDIDAVVVGLNSNYENDKIYNEAQSIFENTPYIKYKHIFGESFTSSAMAFYLGAKICKGSVLLYNHFQNKNHSLILLSSC